MPDSLALRIGEHPSTTLRDHWKVVRKRLGLLFAVPIVFLGYSYLRDLMAVRLYTATATILVKARTPQLFDTSGNGSSDYVDSGSSDSDIEANTENQLLRSRSLAERVVLEENLAKNAAFAGHGTKKGSVPVYEDLGSSHGGSVGSGRDSGYAWTLSANRQETPALRSLVGRYLGGLRVTPVSGTELVDITFTTADAALSAELANAHAEEFIRWGIELNAQASEQAEKFLEGKLTDLKEQLEASDNALNAYRREKGIVPGLISVDGNESVVLGRLEKVSHDAQDARLKVIGLETKMTLVKEGRGSDILSVTSNGLIQPLKQKLDELQTKYALMAAEFTLDYPPMAKLHAEIAATQAALKEETDSSVAEVTVEYEAALTQQKALDEVLNKERAFALGLNDTAVRYTILARDVNTNRQLYNAVLKRMKDLTLVDDLHASKVSVVDHAQVPSGPSSPRLANDLLFSGFLGIAAALGLIFLLERLDDTLGDSDDAERFVSYPKLAALPDTSTVVPYNAYSAYIRGERKKGPPLNRLMVNPNSQSLLSEGYRKLRTAILLSRAGAEPKSALFTSTIPDEGKSTIAINIGIVLASTGRTVLLIDADLRRPRCHQMLSMPNHLGLTEVLIGAKSLEEVVNQSTVKNLFLLSSGEIPPNPSELLGSEKMREILAIASVKYDYLLLDSPPIAAVSDAALLSRIVDGVVFVIERGRTPKGLVKGAISELEQARAKIFGFVFNKAKMTEFSRALHYNGYYYGLPHNGAAEIEDESPDVSTEA